MHDFLKKPKRTHVKEIPLAPILDLLTVVIFFLLLSASFIEVRQNTVPPSSTSFVRTESLSSSTIPLSPKLLVMMDKEGKVSLLMKWYGGRPGQLAKSLTVTDANYSLELKNSVAELVGNFKKLYPAESSVQLGWQSDVKYQIVLTVVDGALQETKDLVFLSPEDSEILFKKSI